jgi:hypothetical protein
MQKSSPSSSEDRHWIKGEYVIYWGLAWSVISLTLYLNFSVVDPGTMRPQWFILTTIGFEQIGLLISGYLCLRNWQHEYIPSGKTVWLLFAIAMLAFWLGNLWFIWWELVWGLDPAASAGNVFFSLFYLILIAGVRLAILDRDIQLASQQWVAVTSIATCGLIIGCWLTTISTRAELPLTINPSMSFPATQTSGSKIPLDRGTIAPIKPPIIASQSDKSPQLNSPKHPPAWVLAIDRLMQPLVTTFNLFYVLCDLILLLFAAILFLGSWGGQLGLPWRMTAQAVLCFYIADTWFAYAHSQMQGYESGFIIEVFWVFGIVQFGIAAALEFDRSIHARRLARRRTAIK